MSNFGKMIISFVIAMLFASAMAYGAERCPVDCHMMDVWGFYDFRPYATRHIDWIPSVCEEGVPVYATAPGTINMVSAPDALSGKYTVGIKSSGFYQQHMGVWSPKVKNSAVVKTGDIIGYMSETYSYAENSVYTPGINTVVNSTWPNGGWIHTSLNGVCP